jgi:putative oxidoreductase
LPDHRFHSLEKDIIMTSVSLNASAAAAAPATGTSASLAAAAGRVLLAAIFLLSGFSKLADPAGTMAYIEAVGLPLPQLALAVAIAVELLGGIALILGFKVRLVALGLAVFSVVTAFAFHAAFADPNQFIHFFKNIAMTGGLLQVAAFGAGRFGLDRR